MSSIPKHMVLHSRIPQSLIMRIINSHFSKHTSGSLLDNGQVFPNSDEDDSEIPVLYAHMPNGTVRFFVLKIKIACQYLEFIVISDRKAISSQPLSALSVLEFIFKHIFALRILLTSEPIWVVLFEVFRLHLKPPEN